MTIVDFTSSGSNSWTCPAGVKLITIRLIGAGSDGESAGSGRGGGGGGYVRIDSYSVTPGTVYNFAVGAKRGFSAYDSGADTNWNSGEFIAYGANANAGGSTGGSGTASYAVSGGNGGFGNSCSYCNDPPDCTSYTTENAGGGGGSAGSDSGSTAGGDATCDPTTQGTGGVVPTGPGGSGGDGGTGNGTGPGGGGGGAFDFGTPGSGVDGMVRIEYDPPYLSFTYTPDNTEVNQIINTLEVTAHYGDDNTLISSFAGSVTLSIGTGTGSLGGTLTATASSGVASWSNVTSNTIQTGLILKASTSGFTDGFSNAFNILSPTTNLPLAPLAVIVGLVKPPPLPGGTVFIQGESVQVALVNTVIPNIEPIIGLEVLVAVDAPAVTVGATLAPPPLGVGVAMVTPPITAGVALALSPQQIIVQKPDNPIPVNLALPPLSVHVREVPLIPLPGATLAMSAQRVQVAAVAETFTAGIELTLTATQVVLYEGVNLPTVSGQIDLTPLSTIVTQTVLGVAAVEMPLYPFSVEVAFAGTAAVGCTINLPPFDVINRLSPLQPFLQPGVFCQLQEVEVDCFPLEIIYPTTLSLSIQEVEFDSYAPSLQTVFTVPAGKFAEASRSSSSIIVFGTEPHEPFKLNPSGYIFRRCGPAHVIQLAKAKPQFVTVDGLFDLISPVADLQPDEFTYEAPGGFLKIWNDVEIQSSLVPANTDTAAITLGIVLSRNVFTQTAATTVVQVRQTS